MRNIHPGEILREEITIANELTITAAAKMLGFRVRALTKTFTKSPILLLKCRIELRKDLVVQLRYR